jgi:zinc D-Ala-D-Ala carboxypeptidase
MSRPLALPRRSRHRLYAAATLVLAVLLLPAAFARRPGRARELACRWALRRRFPTEDLTGLTDGARAAFTAARTDALWRHAQLIGLTSGYRSADVQRRMFEQEVRRCGSPASARRVVLPPAESRHVQGIALDVRPCEGARWLDEHGHRYDLYRMYDNEWWHFEYHPGDGAPPRRPTPAWATPSRDGDITRTGRRHPRPRIEAMTHTARTHLVAPRALTGALAALTLVTITATGCSSGPAQGSIASSSATSVTGQDKAVKFAECIRAHGVKDFPDPDASGDFNYGVSVSLAVWQKAVQACKALQPPGTLSSDRNPAQQEAALKFAQCIRDNGVKDFPDPVNGQPLINTNLIPSSQRAGGMTILNAAIQKCSNLVYQGAGHPK